MIELGPSVSYVYKTEDGLNGFEEAQLIEARRMLNGDIPEAVEMDAMLGKIIGSSASRDVIREFGEDGKFLFSAVTNRHGTATPEGLLYADGTRIEDAPTFKAVKMGIWVVAEGVKINGGKMWAEGRERIRDTLLDLSFTDAADDDDLDWGIPVERTTIITPLHPQEGDISAPFAYGHRKDFKAIAGLAVPSALKAKITELVQAEHQAELDQ